MYLNYSPVWTRTETQSIVSDKWWPVPNTLIGLAVTNSEYYWYITSLADPSKGPYGHAPLIVSVAFDPPCVWYKLWPYVDVQCWMLVIMWHSSVSWSKQKSLLKINHFKRKNNICYPCAELPYTASVVFLTAISLYSMLVRLLCRWSTSPEMQRTFACLNIIWICRSH